MPDDFLGPLERRVMRQLWAHGAQTVAEVRETLNDAAERKLAYTTVMTILVRLHHKGYVQRRGTSQRYTYVAAMDEAGLTAAIGQHELSRLIERYGATELARFAQNLDLDADLAQRLSALSQEKSKRSP